MVMEPDIIKSDMAAAHDQIRGIAFVTDVWRDRQELKHRFNVGQCLPYFAVDRPDKSKWLGKLHQKHMDHDKIANGLRAALNGLCR